MVLTAAPALPHTELLAVLVSSATQRRIKSLPIATRLAGVRGVPVLPAMHSLELYAFPDSLCDVNGHAEENFCPELQSKARIVWFPRHPELAGAQKPAPRIGIHFIVKYSTPARASPPNPGKAMFRAII